ncbi:hypothetical protein ZWY2020_011269 [Hordeum vulgare]|nr:hypothetical protein ZWY2020_011269 [Hordeum vulgare]
MNKFRNVRSLLSRILMRCEAPASHASPAPQRLMQMQMPRATATHSARVLRWYDEPRKAAAATAVGLSAAVMAVRSRYDREVVPCTSRSHLVLLTPEEERHLGESTFAEYMATYKNEIVDPREPASVRVRLIAGRILHAANRGLGIHDSRDSPMLRVTVKQRPKRRGAWTTTTPQPDTRHLRGLKWELVIVRDDGCNAGCNASGKLMVTTGLLDSFKTDQEIAAILAHEIGHFIARHSADITQSEWLPPFVRRIYARRLEIEADYIGMLLLGAAGFHPHWALLIIEKAAQIITYLSFENSHHPTSKKRRQILSHPKIMEEAMELYREVTAMDRVTDKYFSNHTGDTSHQM